MNRYQFLVILLFALATAPVEAQTSYIVTLKGDTIRGEIKLSNDLNGVQLKSLAPDGKKVSFTAVQIRTVFVDGEFYNPQRYEHAYPFMKLLKLGYLSLYAFREPNQTSFDGRLLVKRDGTSVEVPNMMFKRVMSNFLNDCPELTRKIKDGELKNDAIGEVVDTYNSCIETATRKLYGPTEAASKPNSRSILVENFKRKVRDLPEFPNKKNAIDLLNDMSDKLTHGQPVPDYLTEGLKNYLGTIDQVKEDLEKLISTLKG